MKVIKQIFDFYLDASVHVAIGVFSLLQATVILNNIERDGHLGIFLFFGTIACYNFIKYGVEAEKYILVNNKHHKTIQVFSIICLIVSLYHGFYLEVDSWYVLGILFLLTGLYALPVLPRAKNLRSLGGSKIFMVALVWAGVTVVVPLIETGKVLVWDDWVSLVQRIIFVLVLLIPFEIRDLPNDNPALKTIPQRIGVTKTKIFGGFLVLGFFFITFLKDSLTEIELISKGVLFLVLGILVYMTKRKQTKYFSSFWVEVVPVFWLGIVCGLNILL